MNSFSIRIFAANSIHDCEDVRKHKFGDNAIGIQEISIVSGEPAAKVECDPEGWTVFQSRGQFGNSKYYFLRDWEAYEKGFGQAGKI